MREELLNILAEVCEEDEVKTDMDLERLPSGKFATNALILELG